MTTTATYYISQKTKDEFRELIEQAKNTIFKGVSRGKVNSIILDSTLELMDQNIQDILVPNPVRYSLCISSEVCEKFNQIITKENSYERKKDKQEYFFQQAIKILKKMLSEVEE